MTTTPTLGLTQFEATDTINFLTQYNTDLSKIDTAVKANQTSIDETNVQVATKANQTSLDVTNAIVAQKADKSEVTNIMTPKGNLSYASLPATGNTVGWYYYCPDGDGTHGAGNYVWNGTAWYFGGTGDEGYNILNENLTDYIIKEKTISTGVEKGWYGLSGGNIVENSHPTWTRTHLIAPFGFNSLRFTIGTQIKCVFVVENGVITPYEMVGLYDIDVSNKSDIYLNFFGSSYVNAYYLYYAFKPYESGYIKFKVPVNQKIVSINNYANQLLDNENSLASVTCHLKLPTSYRTYGKKTKLLMICHGAGRGITVENPTDHGTWETNNSYNNLIDTFVNAGYAIFDCNGYKDDFWGCNFWGAHRGVEAWKKAYDYIVKNYNVEESFSIYGFSMGALTAMHLVMNGFPNIKCVALGSPVLDLEKCWEDGQVTVMQSAYGMSSTYEPAKAYGCDPVKHLVTISDTEYCLSKMPPIKIWYGSTELGIAVNKTYASRMITAITNSGYWGNYREVEGEGHGICFGSNANINLEYLYWINRFNN